MEQKQQASRLLSALMRSVAPAALGALGAMASLLPVQFAAFCNGGI